MNNKISQWQEKVEMLERVRGTANNSSLRAFKSIFDDAIFHVTFPAMPFLDKLRKSLHRLTCLAIPKTVAREVGQNVAQSRTDFYFVQRLI